MQPAQVEERVDDAAHAAPVAKDGGAEGEGRPRGDAPGLEAAGGEGVRLHDAAKGRARVGRAGGGQAAAEPLPVGGDDAKVGVERMLVDQPVEERVADGGILPAHLGKLGQGGEELLRELDEALVVRRGEPREHKGVVPDPVAGCPALLDPRLQGEAEGGQHRDEDQEDEARAKTRDRRPAIPSSNVDRLGRQRRPPRAYVRRATGNVECPLLHLPIRPAASARARSTMTALKGSRTHENLKHAFAAESQANRRYLYFARAADIEGYPEIGGLFRDTSEAETGHAFGHLDFLKPVGDPATDVAFGNTKQNLQSALEGETYEYTQMYPGMARTAREEGLPEIAEWFEALAKAERSHAGRFTKALENLKEL